MSNYLKSGDFIGGSKFLNDVADSTVTGQPDVLGVFPGTAYGGGLTAGDYLRLTDAEALQLSDTVTGTLFGGIYRRVLLKAGITGGGNTGFQLGSIVFWDLVTAGANPYQVTNVEATDPQLIAGVVINANDTVGAPLSGKWVWIQTAGVASPLYRGTVTSALQFNSVYWAKAGAGVDNAKFDALAGATAVTTLIQAEYMGIAIKLPVNASVVSGGLLMVGIEPRRI
jgi:hypothetical protein